MKLAPFELERYFAQYEFSARWLLCASDCESLALRDLLALEAGARERFESLWLGYTESRGSPALRAAIAAQYAGLAPDDILIHAGAEEAIFNFMHVALAPGDHVVVHAPCYQSLAEVARGIGARVSEWRGDPRHAWALDLDDLKQLLTPHTRLVVVNFPNNPTGYLPPASFVAELSALSDQHGFTLFSDEVYRGLELDPDDRLPSLADLNERAVALGVMSKAYGLAGLRIGWLATRDTARLRELASFKDYTTICNSAPSEFLATLALHHADAIVECNRRLVRDNLDRLNHFFAAHQALFDWYRPKAGSIAFPSLRQGGVAEFCADLVARAGVLLLPGTLYGSGYNAFRIGFGRRNLPEALEKFEAYLQQSGRDHA